MRDVELINSEKWSQNNVDVTVAKLGPGGDHPDDFVFIAHVGLDEGDVMSMSGKQRGHLLARLSVTVSEQQGRTLRGHHLRRCLGDAMRRPGHDNGLADQLRCLIACMGTHIGAPGRARDGQSTQQKENPASTRDEKFAGTARWQATEEKEPEGESPRCSKERTPQKKREKKRNRQCGKKTKSGAGEGGERKGREM